jgi:biotin carboxyl carrier protein
MAHFDYQLDDELYHVQVEPVDKGYAVTVNGQTFTVAATAKPGELRLNINHHWLTAHLASEGTRRWVAFDSAPYVLTVPPTGPKSRGKLARGHEALEAQMPGLVRKVLVAAGEAVEQGQPLLVLEAMKMEIRISAPHAGTVTSVLVRAGETVGRGQRLVELNT